MLRISIIGFGFVGKAVHKAFEHNASTTVVDILDPTMTVDDLAIVEPQIVFICVPAPTLDDGTVDISIISEVFNSLVRIKYTGIVVLKSTIPPHSAESFAAYGLRYIYSPEFLRQHSWEYDAVNPASIILSGDYLTCRELEKLYIRHSHLPRSVVYYITDYKSAALAKYAINTYLATKVVFMNQLKLLHTDICGPDESASWKSMVEILVSDPRFGISHNDVPGPDGLYGYGGACFPKDVKAMAGFDKNSRLSLLKEAELSNTKIRLL